MKEDAIKTTLVEVTGYLTFDGNNTQIEFLSDGKDVSLSDILFELRDCLVNIKIETKQQMR